MTSAVHAIASLPENALRALAQGLRTGSLNVDSSTAKLADALAISPDVADRLRSALHAGRDAGAGEAGLALAAECAIAARSASAGDQLSRVLDLVLSGPPVEGVAMRTTTAVFHSLLREARHEVLVTSYASWNADEILAPLARFLDDDPARRATVVIDFSRGRNDTTIAPDLAHHLAARFWKHGWPAGSRRPGLYYDPRGLADGGPEAVMHAKVAVIDRRKAFVTSANLTERAHGENIELGVILDHAPTAERIADHFDGLIRAKALVAAPGSGG